MKRILALFSLLLPLLSNGQCDATFDPPLSPRIANYDIDLTLDHEAKLIHASQTLTWKNTSPDTIRELRFYMYLNSFKNTESTFLKGASEIFGQSFSDRKPEEWGWIEVDSIGREGGADLTDGQQYIHPDDDNLLDQSVLQVPLNEEIMPGEAATFHMKFTAKMPKIIVRAGYSKDDYFLFVHWFPQAGVYQKNLDGKWGWNCHQFHRMTEFFADFGSYDVSITCSPHLVLGASGCKVDFSENDDGTVTHRYRVDDVIDFAWTAYSNFEEYIDQWEHVEIKLLIPPEHNSMAQRYIQAVKHSLTYLAEHVGEYPYPTITIVDPPLHALRSGLMEYPTLITAGTFWNMPKGVRGSEALAVHEFSHQYFMGMVASNEKEEAWLDEGFVTYFEDRIVDHAYGKKNSLFDILGYRMGSWEKSRQEYVGMPNPKVGTIARPSWEFTEGRKGLIYAKTATSFRMLENMLGTPLMDKVMQTHFERWKFKHPKGQDFLDVLHEVVSAEENPHFGDLVLHIFKTCLYTTDVCDYAVASISNNRQQLPVGIFDKNGEKKYVEGGGAEGYISQVKLYRHGEMIFPLEVEMFFENGTKIIERWSGEERTKIYEYRSKWRVISAHIDPEQKILLDLDLNNNSMTVEPDVSPLRKIAVKTIFWVQNLMQTVSFLI